MIGVTTSELRFPQDVSPRPHSEPDRTEMALGLNYLRAVERAGGIPVVLPPLGLEAIGPLLGRINGLLLSGGPDLDPSAYGQRPHAELGPTVPQLDAFEVALAEEASRRELPILGICRGAQTLNVARGGTLHQHVLDHVDGSVVHRQRESGTHTTHTVEVSPESELAEIIGRATVAVNSFHHQAVDRLGDGLTAVAWSTDGLIEAIEDRQVPLALGVQWHAETLVEDPRELALFVRLVDVCRELEEARVR
ncbi:MAG: gamma-glutamyl-gamma-aminobutyrate hydrolase family protein [Solirubrobacteraceae bacterium]